MPEAPGGRDVLHRTGCASAQVTPRAVQTQRAQIGRGRHAEHVLKAVLERAAAHVQLLAKLGHADRPRAMGEHVVARLRDDPAARRRCGVVMSSAFGLVALVIVAIPLLAS